MNFNAMLPKAVANKPFVMDAALAGGMAYLESELEKLDPMLREPLVNSTYTRDIIVESGGGWVEYISSFNVDYAATEGLGGSRGGVSNGIQYVQANISKDITKVREFKAGLSVKFEDMQKGIAVGRNLENLLNNGVRMLYDRYMNNAVYLGAPEEDMFGLINNPNVAAVFVDQNAAGNSTEWDNKTAEEILADVDAAIYAGWAGAEFDDAAIPNHILVDPESFRLLNNRVMTVAGTTGAISILNYLLQNNIARANNVDLHIYPCRYCTGAGVDGSNRMVAYRNEARFCNIHVPVELTRALAMPNIGTMTFDTVYASLVGETRIHYFNPFIYRDGI